MEKEGCIRAMEFIENQGLEVGLFVSDRHIQISKWMHEEMPETDHKYDVWHIARSKFVVECTILFHMYTCRFSEEG